MTAKLIALVLPMGLDTLGVALALGVAGLPARRRLRLSLWFAGFEAAMPLIGAALGSPLGHAIGSVADYVAAGLLAALGIATLIGRGDEDRERLLSITRPGLAGALLLGISISLDELAIGFSAGLLRLPILAIAIAAAVQAFAVTQLGLRLGARVSSRARAGAGELASEAAARLAGIALLALAAVLVAERLS